jgi:hypothetical protein
MADLPSRRLDSAGYYHARNLLLAEGITGIVGFLGPLPSLLRHPAYTETADSTIAEALLEVAEAVSKTAAVLLQDEEIAELMLTIEHLAIEVAAQMKERLVEEATELLEEG